ncbi:MAG: hypothetical protein HY921_05275 [Elusimicrobia bacterium]|nr:hypothetical protein [Elusimicrobiota bacterium]
MEKGLLRLALALIMFNGVQGAFAGDRGEGSGISGAHAFPNPTRAWVSAIRGSMAGGASLHAPLSIPGITNLRLDAVLANQLLRAVIEHLPEGLKPADVDDPTRRDALVKAILESVGAAKPEMRRIVSRHVALILSAAEEGRMDSGQVLLAVDGIKALEDDADFRDIVTPAIKLASQARHSQEQGIGMDLRGTAQALMKESYSYVSAESPEPVVEVVGTKQALSSPLSQIADAHVLATEETALLRSLANNHLGTPKSQRILAQALVMKARNLLSSQERDAAREVLGVLKQFGEPWFSPEAQEQALKSIANGFSDLVSLNEFGIEEWEMEIHTRDLEPDRFHNEEYSPGITQEALAVFEHIVLNSRSPRVKRFGLHLLYNLREVLDSTVEPLITAVQGQIARVGRPIPKEAESAQRYTSARDGVPARLIAVAMSWAGGHAIAAGLAGLSGGAAMSYGVVSLAVGLVLGALALLGFRLADFTSESSLSFLERRQAVNNSDRLIAFGTAGVFLVAALAANYFDSRALTLLFMGLGGISGGVAGTIGNETAFAAARRIFELWPRFNSEPFLDGDQLYVYVDGRLYRHQPNGVWNEWEQVPIAAGGEAPRPAEYLRDGDGNRVYMQDGRLYRSSGDKHYSYEAASRQWVKAPLPPMIL